MGRGEIKMYGKVLEIGQKKSIIRGRGRIMKNKKLVVYIFAVTFIASMFLQMDIIKAENGSLNS